MSEGKKTQIDQGLIARLTGGLKSMFGVKEADQAWMGPGQPIQPVANDERDLVRGRRLDYPVFVNTQQRKNRDERITFEDLRALSDHDLIRIIIENQKDKIVHLDWHIVDKEGKETDLSEELQNFFACPDGENTWDVWLKSLLEDMYVIDAACVYIHRNKGGKVFSLDQIDGALIKRIIDARGKTPLPPEPAYQQFVKGMPAVNYTRDELVYAPRNLRSNRLYGTSVVEQVITMINISIRRQVSQLQYYTEGNVPEALIGTPADWTPEQVADFQIYWDNILEGDTAARRHARFVPGGTQYIQTKLPGDSMKDKYDEWIARVFCFALGISAQPFVEMMNRATAENATEEADQNGLNPIKTWIRNLINKILIVGFGVRDLRFEWKDEKELDPSLKAKIHCDYVAAGIMTINEVRKEIGLNPIEGGDETINTEEEEHEDESLENSEEDEGKDKPNDKKKEKPKTKTEKVDVHVHLPENLVKVENFTDVPPSIIHIHKD